MNKNYSKTYKNSFLAQINKLKYLPNWTILLIDIVIVIFSGFVTFFLFRELDLNYILPAYFFSISFFYLLVNIFFFFLLKTYSGVVRHTSLVDGVKLMFSQFLTFLVIIIIDYFLIYVGKSKIMIYTASLFNAFLSLSLLLIFRISVKEIFANFISKIENKNKINILIYGLDRNAISVANVLLAENPRRYTIIGFLNNNNNNNNNNKRILNLPIIEIKKSVPITMRLVGAEALILSDSLLTLEERNKIIESCIEYNFKVFMAPILSDAENSSANIKNYEITDLLERNPIQLDTQLIQHKLSKKTILITGAAGSIGSEIVRQICNYDIEKIILVDQAETPLNDLVIELGTLMVDLKIETFLADVRNLEISEQLFKKTQPNIVFHAAAYKHVPLMEENPNQAILANVLGTKNIADLSLKYKVENFIMISTDKAVNPTSIMGASKRIAEMYVQSKQLDSQNQKNKTPTKYITTRFGNVLGSNGSVVPLFTKQIASGGPITLTDPEVIRYFMTIPEACQLVLEACSMGNGGEIYIFDMGKPVKIIDLAKKMIQLAGYKPNIDIQIKIIGLRAGEKLYEELLNDSAKSLQTHNEKILIATEKSEDYDSINNQIEALIQNAQINEYTKIINSIKGLVPDYVAPN